MRYTNQPNGKRIWTTEKGNFYFSIGGSIYLFLFEFYGLSIGYGR